MPLAKKIKFNNQDPLIAIIVSLVVASVLTVYPVSYTLSAWRPSWMFLVMFFWIMCQPAWCGIWFAFVVGLFSDLLLHMPLGVNALCFVCITFAVRYFTRDKRIMTVMNLWVIFCIVEIAYLIFLGFILLIMKEKMSVMHHWLPFLSSIFIAPVVYLCLRKWRAA